MNYYITDVKVKTGNPLFDFFLVEDLRDNSRIYTLSRDSCKWFDAIAIEDALKVFVQSDGIILSVLERTSEKEIDLREQYKKIDD